MTFLSGLHSSNRLNCKLRPNIAGSEHAPKRMRDHVRSKIEAISQNNSQRGGGGGGGSGKGESKASASPSAPVVKKCGACDAVALWSCYECNQDLCHDCNSSEHAPKSTRNHHRHAIDTAEAEIYSLPLTLCDVCEDEPRLPASWACRECAGNFCDVCNTDEHSPKRMRAHNRTPIKQLYDARFYGRTLCSK
jgi:hypothetical protein